MQKFAQATTLTANHRHSLALGLLGVLGFSLTLPATRLALQGLEPAFVGLGRALIAAVLAAIALWITRSPLPSGRQWLRLACTALGVVVGFPLLTAFAMETVPAVHGAVIVGLIPLTTALFAIQLAGERPNWLFWLTTLIGCAVILAFAFSSGAGALQSADIMLLIGVTVAGYGYAEGARLSKEIGAWQTISWALLVSVPVLLPPAVMTAPADIFAVEWVSLLGFAYVSIVSMYLAFIAWYQGLAMGGIAQIGQLQLLQPFLTLLSAALILGESVETSQLAAALIVLSCVAVGRRAA
ncbi:DMT family transporter [Nitrosomonas halophila]|uniref:EamA-like transporter family protein n=1 Tax=Nitrosomonas halophila TaxID=44576 RepID=A0A1H3JX22_9PROT|nr:DMT family transporter [Nitrosomonas halophila]SDY44476.1 EamA-like transporter family protein [Nitrosomonas halophila]